jgi:hypothetical protein
MLTLLARGETLPNPTTSLGAAFGESSFEKPVGFLSSTDLVREAKTLAITGSL